MVAAVGPAGPREIPMLVMKFGGSSVADRAQIEKVQAIVRGRAARRPVVVSSAHKGITNALIAAGEAARTGAVDAAASVIAKQRAIAAELGCPPSLLDPLFDELVDLCRGIRLVRELSPRSLDTIASFGERMAVRVIADFFTRTGLAAKAFDVWDLGFVTDSAFGQARPLPGYEARMREAFRRLVPDGYVPIVTGFVGKDAAGDITTVGRNGSDLTATLVAAGVGAEEVEIWSDTDGVMTADPRLVDGARNIPRMSFDEAAELAYFGSRVLHPETLVPAMARGIPVRVLNTNRADHPGTVITAVPDEAGRPVTSIAYKQGQCVLTVSSTRMLAQHGFLGRLFDVTARHRITVDVVATSEVSVSFTSDDKAALEAAMPELSTIGTCRLTTGKTILAVVGHRLPERAGAGAWVLGALARADVNVEMLSFAEGSINLTMVIDDASVDRAVRALHGTLFEG
jgi:aspartate kinase